VASSLEDAVLGGELTTRGTVAHDVEERAVRKNLRWVEDGAEEVAGEPYELVAIC
jgi:hypothetical protein